MILSKNKFVTFSIVIAVFMTQLDATIVNVSLPSITSYFSTTIDWTSWCVMAYLFSLSSFLILFGKLIDRNGIKGVFIFGYSIFTIFSFFCGISPNIILLIIFRFFQGIGGAALVVSVFSMVPKIYPKEQTGTIFGLITTASAIGITLGSPIGGFLTYHLSWHWIFLINVPIGIAAILLTMKNIKKDSKDLSVSKPKLDIAGNIIYSFGVLTFIFAISQIDNLGFTSPIIISLIFLSIIVFISFYFYERRLKYPLIDFKFFNNSRLILALLSAAFAFMILSANNFLMPFYIENILNFTTDNTGLLLLGFSLPVMFIGPFAGKLSGKNGGKIICIIGLILTFAAFLVFSVFLGTNSLILTLLVLIFSGFGYGLFNSPSHNFIKNSVNDSEIGLLFGIEQTIIRFSMALGVIFIETIYSFQMMHTISASKNESMVAAFNLCFGFEAAFCFLAVVVMAFAGIKKKQKV